MPSQISSRKDEHVQICKNKEVSYKKSAGFEDIELLHNAMPEADFSKIDTSTFFLGKKLSFPFMIDAITGGYSGAAELNKRLAKAAEEKKVAFALGSIRAMIENEDARKTFAVRDVAPSIPLLANIGIAQLKQIQAEKILSACESLEVNAIQVHLNPLQEVLQKEGDKNFEGLLGAMADFCSSSKLPVIAKETGAGISPKVALLLKKAGVKMLNVSGAGGTSWARVEYKRGKSISGFEEWGLPSAACTIACSKILPTISSGGIRSGIDAAKAICCGAVLASSALPFVRSNAPAKILSSYKQQFQTSMFLVGAKSISELGRDKCLVLGKTREYCEAFDD
ncbi:type 2 isopentenyl-diphosphate Delta-isomerase [Candidatus Micrarchaeota archaeon CG1_02_47_40]|nr:MAG: type 2 isopentenyl-diphosphate Delta-isomerase [Candidatus Micrarchaeota archaeon CG1_02_47_40]